MNTKLSILLAACLISVAATAQTPPPQFKTQCLSNICIGDDLNKIEPLTSPTVSRSWLTEENKPKPNPRATARPHAPRLQYLPDVQTAFRNLTDNEYKTLATATYWGEGAPAPDIEFFLDDLETPHVELNALTLPILRNVTTCTALPVHGIFKSESGYYSDILLVSIQGTLRVVRMIRRWTLTASSGANETQQSQAVNKQLVDLFDSIKQLFGGSWLNDRYFVPPVSASARNEDMVAYFNYQDRAHPVLQLYSAAFAKFQKQPINSSPVAWERVKTKSERELAVQPACAVKVPAVKVN